MSNPPIKKKLTNLHRVIKWYDHYAPEYDADYKEDYWRIYDDLTWFGVEPYLPVEKSIPIMDIGGGTAKWAIKLAEKGYYVICTDISQGMLDIANKKITERDYQDRITLQKSDIRSMPEFQDNSFMLTLALGDVISYAIDDDLAVQELFRITKPGGFCIASVDNKIEYIVNEIKSERWQRIESLVDSNITNFFPKHPIKTYFPIELKNLFIKHGFRPIKMIGKPIFVPIIPKKVRKHKFKEFYDVLLNLEKKFCDHQDLIGYGGHIQIIAQKPHI